MVRAYTEVIDFIAAGQPSIAVANFVPSEKVKSA
jgi:hypothetical protein